MSELRNILANARAKLEAGGIATGHLNDLEFGETLAEFQRAVDEPDHAVTLDPAIPHEALALVMVERARAAAFRRIRAAFVAAGLGELVERMSDSDVGAAVAKAERLAMPDGFVAELLDPASDVDQLVHVILANTKAEGLAPDLAITESPAQPRLN